MQILIALMVAVALSGGVSFAARDAEPGDALYSVKANVNDRVEAAADAVLGLKAESKSDVEGSAQTGGNASVNAGADADVESNLNASASSSNVSGDGDINGSIKVDADL